MCRTGHLRLTRGRSPHVLPVTPQAATRPDSLVSGSTNGVDQLGPAELAAELRDVHVDGPGSAGVGHPPDPIEQLVTADHYARILEQGREQVEFLRRQLDRLAVDRNLARVPVQNDVVQREHLFRAAPVGAPQDCLHAGDELARRERLRQVIVGAELEPGDSVGLLVARGEHEDWHVRASPHQPGDVEPVDAGQADVEDDDPDLVPAELGQRLFSRPDPDDAPAAALEITASHRADRMLVLDEQDRALLAPARDGLGVHLPVAKTWSAGLSPSRSVVAIMPVRSWKKLAFLPLSLTRTFGEMLIVTSEPSGSLNRSVKTPTALMRPWSSR